MPRALITGIGGQDGSLLAELLLEEGYEVVGVVRSLDRQYENLEAIQGRAELVELDLGSEQAVTQLLASTRPREVYNLASISLVPRSWEAPLEVAAAGATGVTALLEAIRKTDRQVRFFQASSSEMFGDPLVSPQDEQTPVSPLTPYGAAKAYGHFLTRAFRGRYGLHASSGILFNHESPRRPLEFVTRKVAHSAAAISLGLERELRLGALDARRDWGSAADYVRAMWLAVTAEEPGDYVVATGESHSVEELVTVAFAHVGLDWTSYVVGDDELVRGSSDAREHVGDASRARARLGWKPTVRFEELVRQMVDADLGRLRARLAPA